MLPRSKSAPKSLDNLSTREGPNRPKLIRSQSVQTALCSPSVAPPYATPWEAHNDPFNLARFFPSRLTEEQPGWDWLYDDIDKDKDEMGGDDETGENSNSSSSLYGDIFGHEGYEEEHVDTLVQQVIDGEDKYGMLAFSSDNMPNLFRFTLPTFERPASPAYISPLDVDEPSDVEELHVRHCVRRGDSIDSEKEEHGSKLGDLFFTEDGDNAGTIDVDGIIEFPYWMKMLYGHGLAGKVAWERIFW